MNYLGIHNSYLSGAALVMGGDVIAAVHEERFDRLKNSRNWPAHSIDYVLKEGGIQLGDVDKVVYGMCTAKEPDTDVGKRCARRISDGIAKSPDYAGKFQERLESEKQWNAKHLDSLKSNLQELGWCGPVEFVDHHAAHAASAFYTSPFEDCLVFTCDGKGNFKSSSVYHGSGTEMTPLHYGLTFDSAGYFYGILTKALGFLPERHEGKVLGLAAHGNAKEFLDVTDSMLKFESGEIRGEWGDNYMAWFCGEDDLPNLFQQVKSKNREDVAAACQCTLEKVILQWIRFHLDSTSWSESMPLALAGGVFANVRLNQKIRELPEVDSVYVHPAMGDGGIPLGSCLLQMAVDGHPSKKFLPHAAFGPRISTDNFLFLAEEAGLSYERVVDWEEAVLNILMNEQVLGICRGRMEYGPRALCNRSILYHTRDPGVNDWLNRRLNRTEFMPFAPVTTAELAPACFRGWVNEDRAADFMTITYECTDQFKGSCPAAVHVDGTARPQIVRAEHDPELHSMLTKYHRLTGIPALLNTSFNNHEEPIVCSAADALFAFRRGNVDRLLVNDILV